MKILRLKSDGQVFFGSKRNSCPSSTAVILRAIDPTNIRVGARIQHDTRTYYSLFHLAMQQSCHDARKGWKMFLQAACYCMMDITYPVYCSQYTSPLHIHRSTNSLWPFNLVFEMSTLRRLAYISFSFGITFTSRWFLLLQSHIKVESFAKCFIKHDRPLSFLPVATTSLS